MAKNTSIILGSHFEKFINEEIKSGRYSSTSEVIRSGLRLLQREKENHDLIKQALEKGELSGEPIPFDNDAFLLKMEEKYG